MIGDDILQPISDEELLQYVNILKNDLPKNLRSHHYLLMQYKWNIFLKEQTDQKLIDSISVRCKLQFFKHQNGKKSNCTIIGIAPEGNLDNIDDYTVFIASIEDSGLEVRECIFKTKRINWKLGPLFISTESKHYSILKYFMTENNIKSSWQKDNICLWLPKEKAKLIKYEISDDICIIPLKPNDSEIMDSAWYLGSPGTKCYIYSQIVMNWGLGIVKKDTKELVSWILVSEHFCPGILATLHSERGKGYADLVTKVFCKEFVERENLDLMTIIADTNLASLKLFKKLNFREISEHNDERWILLKVERSENY